MNDLTWRRGYNTEEAHPKIKSIQESDELLFSLFNNLRVNIYLDMSEVLGTIQNNNTEQSPVLLWCNVLHRKMSSRLH